MKKRYIISAIFFLLFILIAVLITKNNIRLFDDNVYNYISSFRNSYLDNIFKIITKFANPISITILVLILLIILKKENIYKLILTVSTTVLLNQALKHLIRRPRPDYIRLVSEKGFSFPSGHSMVSLAFYGFIIYLIYKYIKNKKIKVFLITLLSMLIAFIGISRIYLGVHYTSDVCAGFLISISYLIIYTSIVDKFILERE